MMDLHKWITQQISENKVALFMKGTREAPRCGFSARVVQILLHLGVDFQEYDVLENEDLRQAIKEFSDWPTIPQLYINGEFIGGCDIVMEMFQSGELSALLGQKSDSMKEN